MAEKKDEKAEAQKAAPEEGGGSKKKKLIIFAIVGVLVIGGAAGGIIFFLGKGGGESKPHEGAAPAHGAEGEHKAEEPAKDHGEAKDEKKEEHGEKAAEHGKEEKKEEGHGEKKEEGGHGEKKAEGKEKGKEGEKGGAVDDGIDFGQTYQFKTFHMNLGNPLENHYIRLDIAAEYKGGDSQLAEIEKRMPQLRDAVNAVVSRKSREFLLGPDGKAELRRELLIRLNRYMAQPLESVYITDLIIE